MRVNPDDLPEAYQKQIAKQLAPRPRRRPEKGEEAEPKPGKKRPRGAKLPTAAETRYYDAHLRDKQGVWFEGLTFRMHNGHRYTPDWVYWEDGRLHAVEVKGSYRLQSYQRARLAFDQARVEFPDVEWIWAEEEKPCKKS